MSLIRNFSDFKIINESQSKKIRKYVDFSTFLDWYNNNRQLIADIIDVPVENIVSEEELLKQSSELINDVINPQSSGNDGRDGVVSTDGFKPFDKLKNKIIHDILHSIYNADDKEFDKDMYDFSESEYFEELEVLFLEESFMKYFSNEMDYVSSDFINQNVNRLVSFLMMVIIKNDPNRIYEILEGKVEPYIEVYGKKYDIEGTPFENLYDIFYKIPIDPVQDDDELIEDGNDFKNWVTNMCIYGDAISSENNGDRSSFPKGAFLGEKDLGDLDDDEISEFLSNTNYYYAKYDELEGYRSNYGTLGNYIISEDRYIDLDDIEEILDEDGYSYSEIKLSDLPEDIKNDEEFIDTIGENGEIDKEMDISSINLFLIEDEEDYWSSLIEEGSKYIIEVKYEDSGINDDILFYDNKYKLIDKRDGLFNGYSIDEVSMGDLWESYSGWFDDEIKLIVTDNLTEHSYYNKQSLESNVKSLISDDNSSSIARRYLRHNDTLINNTDIDKKFSREYIKDKVGDTSDMEWGERRNKDSEVRHNLPFQGINTKSFDNYKSMSKNLVTDNAKKLKKVFDTFRGWVIKNFDDVKDTYKSLKKVISKEDLELLNDYPSFIKRRDNVIKSDIYLAYISPEFLNKISYIRDSYMLLRYIDDCVKYDDIFSRIGSEDSKEFKYLKRLPNVKSIEDLKYKKDNNLDILLSRRDLLEKIDIGEDSTGFVVEKDPTKLKKINYGRFFYRDNIALEIKSKEEYISMIESNFLEIYDIRLRIKSELFEFTLKDGFIDKFISKFENMESEDIRDTYFNLPFDLI